MLTRESLPLYNPFVGDCGESNVKYLPVAKLGYARQPTDVVTIALRTENLTKRAMEHRRYHFFVFALFWTKVS
jgi:hypothetical protein